MTENFKKFDVDDVVALGLNLVLKSGREEQYRTATLINHICGLGDPLNAKDYLAFSSAFLREQLPILSQINTSALLLVLDESSSEDARKAAVRTWLDAEKARLGLADTIEIPTIEAALPADSTRVVALKASLAELRHP